MNMVTCIRFGNVTNPYFLAKTIQTLHEEIPYELMNDCDYIAKTRITRGKDIVLSIELYTLANKNLPALPDNIVRVAEFTATIREHYVPLIPGSWPIIVYTIASPDNDRVDLLVVSTYYALALTLAEYMNLDHINLVDTSVMDFAMRLLPELLPNNSNVQLYGKAIAKYKHTGYTSIDFNIVSNNTRDKKIETYEGEPVLYIQYFTGLNGFNKIHVSDSLISIDAYTALPRGFTDIIVVTGGSGGYDRLSKIVPAGYLRALANDYGPVYQLVTHAKMVPVRVYA